LFLFNKRVIVLRSKKQHKLCEYTGLQFKLKTLKACLSTIRIMITGGRVALPGVAHVAEQGGVVEVDLPPATPIGEKITDLGILMIGHLPHKEPLMLLMTSCE
jgi:hypothetical protein